MDVKLKKERFESLSIKTSVAKKFRRYSKTISHSQSMSLLLMLEFFEGNGLSPKESIGPHIQTLENLIKKRINGMVAIMKDIEKTQTKPTTAMLQLLFEQTAPKRKEPLYVERTMEEIEASKSEEEKLLDHYREQYFTINRELFEIKEDFGEVLNKLVYTKNTFGSNYYRLNIPKEEFKKIEQKLNNENKDDNSETF